MARVGRRREQCAPITVRGIRARIGGSPRRRRAPARPSCSAAGRAAERRGRCSRRGCRRPSRCPTDVPPRPPRCCRTPSDAAGPARCSALPRPLRTPALLLLSASATATRPAGGRPGRRSPGPRAATRRCHRRAAGRRRPGGRARARRGAAGWPRTGSGSARRAGAPTPAAPGHAGRCRPTPRRYRGRARRAPGRPPRRPALARDLTNTPVVAQEPGRGSPTRSPRRPPARPGLTVTRARAGRSWPPRASAASSPSAAARPARRRLVELSWRPARRHARTSCWSARASRSTPAASRSSRATA